MPLISDAWEPSRKALFFRTERHGTEKVLCELKFQVSKAFRKSVKNRNEVKKQILQLVKSVTPVYLPAQHLPQAIRLKTPILSKWTETRRSIEICNKYTKSAFVGGCYLHAHLVVQLTLCRRAENNWHKLQQLQTLCTFISYSRCCYLCTQTNNLNFQEKLIDSICIFRLNHFGECQRKT
jgi:hypothetical protein